MRRLERLKESDEDASGHGGSRRRLYDGRSFDDEFEERSSARGGPRFAWISGLSCLVVFALGSMFALMFLVYREQVAIQRATLDVLREGVGNGGESRQTIVYYRTNETLHSILSVAARPRSAAATGEDLTAEEESYATSTEAAFFAGFTVSPSGCAPPRERVRLEMMVFFSRLETRFMEDEHYLIQPRGFLSGNTTVGYGTKMPTSDGNSTEGVWTATLSEEEASSESFLDFTTRRVEMVSRCIDTGYSDSNGLRRRSKPWAVRDVMRDGASNVEIHVMFSITNDYYVRGLRSVRLLLSRETFDL